LDEKFISNVTSAPPATVATDIYAQLRQRGPVMIAECERILDGISIGLERPERVTTSLSLRNLLEFILVRRNAWLLIFVLLVIVAIAVPEESFISRTFGIAIIAAIVIWGMYLTVQRAVIQTSQIKSSDALHRIIDKKEGLLDRADDTAKIANLCERVPLVVLTGESGVGKSAVLRSGLASTFTERTTVDYVYVDRCGEEWDDGPRRAIARCLTQQLLPLLGSKLTASRNPTNAELIRLIEDIHASRRRTILIALDAFDEYIRGISNQLVDPNTGAWVSPHTVQTTSAFWSLLAGLVSRDIVHIVFAVRIDERGGMNSFYFTPPTIYTLDRLPRSSAITLLSMMTQAGFAFSRQVDWLQLQQQLASDLNQEGEEIPGGNRILPIQMIVALKGLRTLSQLTVNEYRRSGGLVGLERRFVQDCASFES
jgi:hypothetical protein